MRRWLSHSADFRRFPIRRGRTLVDVGCGLGATSVAAARAGARVVAVDVCPRAIEHTTAALQAAGARDFRAEVSDGYPLPIREATADLVVCTEVLEHVDDPPAFARELARVGKAGARYLFSVPAPESEGLMKRVVLPSYFEWPGHLRVYERESFVAMLGEAGLSVVEEPVYPHGFYWSVYWPLGWASGSPTFGPGCPTGDPPLLEAWSALYAHLEYTRQGNLVTEYLDRMVPKSHVVIARKATPSTAAPPRTIRGGESGAAPGFLAGIDELLDVVHAGESRRKRSAREALERFSELLAQAPGGPALLPGLDALPVGAAAWQHDQEWGSRVKARARRGRQILRDWAARFSLAR